MSLLKNPKSEEQNKQIEKQIVANQQLYKRVFDTPEGQSVLKDLKKRCFINSTTYDDNHGRMSLQEGRRSIYVYITNLINKDIKEILEEITK